MFRDTNSSELDLGALFSASPNAYVVFDTDLRIVGCNDAYLKAVQRDDRTELVGKPLFEAFPADPGSDGYKLLRGSLQRVIATAQPDELALIPYDVARDGEPSRLRYWSATHTPLFDSRQNLRYILQHTTDVTELQQLREQNLFGMQEGANMLRRARELQAENQSMLAESDWLRQLFMQAPGFLAVLHGRNHVFQIANTAYQRLVGRDVVGQSVRDALPEVVEQGFVALLDEVWETGRPYVGEHMPAMLGGQQRYVDFLFQPIRDHEGRISGILVQGIDLTDQLLAQQEVVRQQEYLRMAQEAGGFGTFEWNVETDEIIASPAFRRLYGFAEDDAATHADDFAARIHPEDAHLMARARVDALDEALKPVEYRVETPTGLRWLGRQGRALRDGQGRITRVLGAAHDITNRKRQEEELHTLARESAHRVRNILTLVQAIVNQTLRRADDMEQAQIAVSQRLQALAATQNALVDGVANDHDLHRLVEETMRLHRDTFGQISIDGPHARLDPRTALGIGLMLHELATNAVKYGALSTEEGRVDIAWKLEGDGRHIQLLWQESGGPPVTAPSGRGFGSSLIERSLTHDSRNSARLDFAPEGVRCTCSIVTAEAAA